MSQGKYYKAKSNIALGTVFKQGNKKIGMDTIIFNLTTATDCPSKALGLCQLPCVSYCYALQDEKRYFHYVPVYRMRQGKYWDMVSAETFAADVLEIVRRRRTRIRYLRFSEAGDFRNVEDIRKMSKVADILARHRIRLYGYSARRDLVKEAGKISANMTINGSGFMWVNSFNALEELPENGYHCKGDCRRCSY